MTFLSYSFRWVLKAVGERTIMRLFKLWARRPFMLSYVWLKPVSKCNRDRASSAILAT